MLFVNLENRYFGPRAPELVNPINTSLFDSRSIMQLSMKNFLLPTLADTLAATHKPEPRIIHQRVVEENAVLILLLLARFNQLNQVHFRAREARPQDHFRAHEARPQDHFRAHKARPQDHFRASNDYSNGHGSTYDANQHNSYHQSRSTGTGFFNDSKAASSNEKNKKTEDAQKALGLHGSDISTLTESEINRAFRKKALRVHPDKNTAPDAEEQFKKLLAQKELLLKLIGART